MLAKPTKAISEVLDRFEGKKFTCEYKYDGERAQVHYLPDKSLRVFSRNSEDMSKKYPDLVEQLPKVCQNLLLRQIVGDQIKHSASKKTLLNLSSLIAKLSLGISMRSECYLFKT